MACFFCFSNDPLSRDEMKGKYGSGYAAFLDKPNTYAVTMCKAPCAQPCVWLGSMICMPCSNIAMRHKALNHVDPGSGWSNYTCCQGYFGGCCCIQPGNLGESTCPVPCMCLEATCCAGLAISATSFMIREKYGLGLDDDDIRLIRCNNCLFCFATIVNLLSCFFDWDGEEACVQAVNCVADVVFCCTGGCMLAQVYNEIQLKDADGGAPTSNYQMER